MGDGAEEEPLSRYFGDYPNGAYFSAMPPEGAADTEPRSRWVRPPWLPEVVRTPENPYPIRMFGECGCDFALWGSIDEPPPTLKPGAEDAQHDRLEEILPITEEMRDRLLRWAEDYYRYDGGDKSIPMDDFDDRGVALSRELQRQLGPLYTVQYHFTFGASRERLLGSVADDPLPGWASR